MLIAPLIIKTQTQRAELDNFKESEYIYNKIFYYERNKVTKKRVARIKRIKG